MRTPDDLHDVDGEEDAEKESGPAGVAATAEVEGTEDADRVVWDPSGIESDRAAARTAGGIIPVVTVARAIVCRRPE